MKYVQTIDGVNECYVRRTDENSIYFMGVDDIINSKDIVGVYNTEPNKYDIIACKYGIYLTEVKDAKECMKLAISSGGGSWEFKNNSIYVRVDGSIDCSELPFDLEGLRFAAIDVNFGGDTIFARYKVQANESSYTISDFGNCDLSVYRNYLEIGSFRLVNVPEVSFCTFKYIYLFENKSWLIHRVGQNKVLIIDLLQVLQDGTGVYFTSCSEDFSIINKDGCELM